MKNTMIALLTMVTSTVAFADGFNCTSESGLNVKVYNHTDANKGTRTGSIMVISDSSVGAGNKTIAKMSDVKGTLSSKKAVYTAKVDLRFADSSHKGELIAGTKLGQLAKIELMVDFSYGAPVKAGEQVEGLLVLTKRNSAEIVENISCVRYLKN